MGKKQLRYDPVSFAVEMERAGAGELIIQSITMDGSMQGYDIDLTKRISSCVNIPVVALGGAGKLSDFNMAIQQGYASAVAAGSMFVYHGPRKGILVNYPGRKELNELFLE